MSEAYEYFKKARAAHLRAQEALQLAAVVAQDAYWALCAEDRLRWQHECNEAGITPCPYYEFKFHSIPKETP